MTLPSAVGPYEILHELGTGATGVVYAARHVQHRERVALKLLSQATPAGLRELKKEFRVVRDVASPHLVPIHDLVLDDAQSYLVMGLVEGRSLSEWAGAAPWRSSATALYRVLSGCLSGLHELHQRGLVHRDVKPSNVLVGADDHAVIVDFGGSAYATRTSRPLHFLTEDAFAGTLAFMAPEVLFGASPDASQDVFSLAATTFEILTGLALPRHPRSWDVQRERVRSMMLAAWDAMPASLLATLDGMLSSEPNLRPSSERALATLRGLLDAPGNPLCVQRLVPRPIGRERELDGLLGFLATPGARCQVLGASGIGKTTLVQHALSSLADGGTPLLILRGALHPGEHLPFALLDEILDCVRRYLLEQRIELQALIGCDAALALSTAFRTLFDLGSEASAPMPPAHSSRQELSASLVALFQSLARRTPVLLWIDDVQWADDDGVKLLADVMASLVEDDLRFVLSGRGVPAEIEVQLGMSMRLEPLELEAARELRDAHVGVLDAGTSTPAGMTWELHAAQGNPGFLCRLAEHVAGARESCASIQDLVEQRLSLLTDSARRTAVALALLGHPAPVPVVRSLCGSTNYRAVAHELACAGMIRPSLAFGSTGFTILHDSLREAILALQPAHTRRSLHADMVAALESFPPLPYEVLATHCEGAGWDARAGELLSRAGKCALESLAFEHAVLCYRRAERLLDGVERVDVTEQLAKALSLAGRAAEAGECYIRVAAHAEGRAREQALQNAAVHLFLTGENEQAIRLLNQLLAPFSLHIPRNPRCVLLSLAYYRAVEQLVAWRPQLRQPHVRTGEARVAELMYEVSTGLARTDVVLGAYAQAVHVHYARRSRCPRRMAMALALEAGYRASAGASSHEVESLLVRGRRSLEESPKSLLLALSAATSAWAQGRWRACVEHAECVEDAVERDQRGAWWALGLARSVLQDALRWSGRYQELKVVNGRYLRDARARGDRFALVTYRARFEATLCLLADKPEQALEACDQIRDWPATGVHLQHLAEFHSRCECLLYCGHADAALSYAMRAWRYMRRAPILHSAPPRAKVYYQLAACRLAVAERGPRSAATLLSAARQDARALRRPGWAYTTFLAELVELSVDRLEARDIGPRAHALTQQARSLGMLQYVHAIELALACDGDGGEAAQRLARLGATQPRRWAAQLLPGWFSVPSRALPRSSFEESLRRVH